jgi:putative Mg2+ transporter-C (MgtC) family protein
MTFWEIVLRLGAATVIGGAIGLNRDMHGKPTGVRTLGVVALGSALVVIAMIDLAPPGGTDPDPVSRAVQGVLTGIGFLGAGVILRGDDGISRVRGLTTAACTWLTACVGLICGTGNWRLLAAAVVFTCLLLTLGGPIEHGLHRRFGKAKDPDVAPPADREKP